MPYISRFHYFPISGDLSVTELELHVNTAHLDFLTPDSDDRLYLEEEGGACALGSCLELDKCAGDDNWRELDKCGVPDSPEISVRCGMYCLILMNVILSFSVKFCD